MELFSIIKIAVAVVLFIATIAAYKLWLRLFIGAVVVPEDKGGLVTKKFVLVGDNKTLPDGSIVALNGEAGVQADMLAPGFHKGYWPWQYSVEFVDFTTIKQGKIGIVAARDGKPLPAGRILGHRVECDSFQNARKFLQDGGERGPQITIIPPGTYRINPKLFNVSEAEVTTVEDNQVGIVTTKEGAPLETGEIAGKEIGQHNAFQDAQKFIDNGGFKGLQEQVILAGRYFINPLFAQVETKPMTEVPIGHVGVVISYVGAEGADQTGDTFKHGNIVQKGGKGVWMEALDPGKYPINTFVKKVEIVPTTNIVLNWANSKNESHKLDANLSTITVRSSDGFPFNLDVSQIIHIPRVSAPKVIARFGNMSNLVTQVLEPTIGNYFRNAAQKADVIDFLKNRTTRQDEAKNSISKVLTDYDVQAVDTLIGDIVPPQELMKTLTDRKLASENEQTYQSQMRAENSKQELNKAKALAEIQPQVVASERNIQIAENMANAEVKKAEGSARSFKIDQQAKAEAMTITATADATVKTVNAEAEANATKMRGDAEAEATLKVGTAQAEVTKLRIASVGSENYALIEVGKALSESGTKLVPDITVGSSDSGHGNGLVDVLLGNMLRDQQLQRERGNNVTKCPPPASN